MSTFCENQFIFNLDHLKMVSATHSQVPDTEGPGKQLKKCHKVEKELLEEDDQFFFSKDQYFSSIRRGVVELDEKIFKIYTQSLLHCKREV